jgi:hypothetical protein
MSVVVVALAATRLIRAWKHEAIGEAPYTAVQVWAGTPVLDGNVVDVPATRRRIWVGDLFACPHCLGVWVAVALSVAWRIRPARVVIAGLASSMLLSMLVDHYPGFDFGDPVDD